MNLEDHGDLVALSGDGSHLLLVLPLAVRSVRLFSLKVDVNPKPLLLGGDEM